MKDEERLIRALNELADIANRKEAEREKEREKEQELEKVRAERRKRFYENAPLFSFSLPQNSSLLNKEDEEGEKSDVWSMMSNVILTRQQILVVR